MIKNKNMGYFQSGNILISSSTFNCYSWLQNQTKNKLKYRNHYGFNMLKIVNIKQQKYEILILRQRKLPIMVHCLNISAYKNCTMFLNKTAIKMKLIFTQLITYYLQSQDISNKVVKLLNGTGLDIYEMNAVISTLSFILHNSVQFHVSDSVLNKQLIDLGLPKENVESISKSYKANRDKLLQKSLQRMPKLTAGLQVQYSIHDFLGSSRLGSTAITPIKFVQLNLAHKNSQNKSLKYDFLLAEDQLQNIIYQLEQVLNLTEKIQLSK